MEYNVAEDRIPLVNWISQPDSEWAMYIDGKVAIRLHRNNEIQVKMGDETAWSPIGLYLAHDGTARRLV